MEMYVGQEGNGLKKNLDFGGKEHIKGDFILYFQKMHKSVAFT